MRESVHVQRAFGNLPDEICDLLVLLRLAQCGFKANQVSMADLEQAIGNASAGIDMQKLNEGQQMIFRSWLRTPAQQAADLDRIKATRAGDAWERYERSKKN